jgi:hypothetical protein
VLDPAYRDVQEDEGADNDARCYGVERHEEAPADGSPGVQTGKSWRHRPTHTGRSAGISTLRQ